MRITPEAYKTMMERYMRWLRQGGKAYAEQTAEDYYGFKCTDVAEVHRNMIGDGDGTWFRLYDGRVFDWEGKAADPDRSLYDKTLH